jgi:hypothetical protein
LLVGENYNHFELPETLTERSAAPIFIFIRQPLRSSRAGCARPARFERRARAMTSHRRMVRHGEQRWRLDGVAKSFARPLRQAPPSA